MILLRGIKRFAMGAAVLAALLSLPTSAALATAPTAPYNAPTFEEDAGLHLQVNSFTETPFGSGAIFSGTDEWGARVTIDLGGVTGAQLAVGTFPLTGEVPGPTQVGISMSEGSSDLLGGLTGSI